MGKPGILWVLAACNLTLVGFLMSGGSFLQDRYPGSKGGVATTVKVGQTIPPLLARRLGSKRVLLMVFPSCRECTLESPDALIGQRFERSVIVLLPGAGPEEIERYRARLGPLVSVEEVDNVTADAFGVVAAPRVFEIDAGVVSYVQPTYVPAAQISEVVNGR